jgi:hypothetical protein
MIANSKAFKNRKLSFIDLRNRKIIQSISKKKFDSKSNIKFSGSAGIANSITLRRV